MDHRVTFSICVPAYNRVRHLRPLLESVMAQDYSDFEIVVCEDGSAERKQIAEIIGEFSSSHPGKIRYFENPVNLGYDANIRNLVEKARGQYCFFLGNDDLLTPGALRHVADLIERHPGVGLVIKSYAWFIGSPSNIQQEIRYFTEERLFPAGPDAIAFAFRRSGVIAGYIVHRDAAHNAATAQFDGTLYYQMHLTASVLATMPAVFTPQILVLCRDGEPPDFGNSTTERGKYTPGRYTPSARVKMIEGALSIVKSLKESRGIDVVDAVTRDYANYFYPYLRDQLELPFREYVGLYRAYGRLGFDRYPMFHVYSAVSYLCGEKRFDALTGRVRSILGRSPHIGKVTR